MRTRIVASMAGLILAGNVMTGAQAASKEITVTAINPAVGDQLTRINSEFTPSAKWNAAIQEETLISSENNQASSIPVVDDEAGEIPNDAVRLRIIANSDSPEDQNLKRQVRDRVINLVGQHLQGITDSKQARDTIQENLPEINKAAEQVVKEKGFSYKVQTDLGMVPFPTKLYGDKVYPSGEYEALRIVLGDGQGQNWWCVLFPPLCFVDVANGDAVQAQQKDTKPLTTIQVPTGDSDTAQTVQVRLGILDLFQSLLTKISNLLHS